MSQLLQPDNEVIKAATAQLRTAFKQPGVIEELCNVLRQVLVLKYLFVSSFHLAALVNKSRSVSMQQCCSGRNSLRLDLGSNFHHRIEKG